MKQRILTISVLLSLCLPSSTSTPLDFPQELKVPAAVIAGLTAGILAGYEISNRTFARTINKYPLHTLSAGMIVPEKQQEQGLNFSAIKKKLLPLLNSDRPPQDSYPLSLQVSSQGESGSSHVLHFNLSAPLEKFNRVVLLSRGYSRPRETSLKQRVGALIATSLIKNNLYIDAPLIFFDYQDERMHCNLGGEKDANVLSKLLKKMYNIAPTSQNVLHGICRGSTAALRCLPREKNRIAMQNISHMIFESPYASGTDLTKRLAESYAHRWFGSILNICMKAFFPSYDNESDLLDKLKEKIVVADNTKILIAHLKGDTYISDSTIEKIIEALRIARKKSQKNFEIYLAVFDDESHTIKHGQLSKAPAFQQLINDFVDNKESEWLKCAKKNAETAKKSTEWKAMPTLVGIAAHEFAHSSSS